MSDPRFQPTGALVVGQHERLLLDIEKITARAGIGGQKHYVWQKLSAVLPDEEVVFVKLLNQHTKNGVYGALYKYPVPNVEKRFMAITGALLRNYVDARYMTLNEVVREAMEDNASYVDAGVLLIPDFHTDGLKLPDWKMQLVASVLQRRAADGDFTFLYTANWPALKGAYGAAMEVFLKKNYEGIGT